MILRTLGLARLSEVEALRAALRDSDERVVVAEGQANEAVRALGDLGRNLYRVLSRIQELGPGKDDYEG